MPDIFISYSRQDADQAQLLTELLSSAGLSVWIDQSDIGAATSWSGEISKAITECKALIVLLSPSSVDSKNVTREVALAFERNKKILPLDLEPVVLPDDFAYHLAGIQRTSMTNIDAIIRALSKLGLEATGAPQPPKIIKNFPSRLREGFGEGIVSRKSLMILPFQDLSPTGDNAWFADGIVSELISALSNVKALNVTDAQTTKDFKRYQGTLPTYAREMQIRYFVEGDVRKFGDNIKITSRLLDIETGDYLWQDSLKGTMNDIFDIQEKVAESVVEGLKIHLASDERKKLAERGTENAEAYELYLKSIEYFNYQNKEGLRYAIQLASEAIALDENFAIAYQTKANSMSELYRLYDRDPALLEESLTLVRDALRMKPDLWTSYAPLSNILFLQGNFNEAEQTAKEYVAKAPQKFSSHFALGFLYAEIGRPDQAIPCYEESLRLRPDDLFSYFNLCNAYAMANEETKLRAYANAALPHYEKHIKLFPGDENGRVQHAGLLHWAGRDEEAKRAIRKLENVKDAKALFNIACFQCSLGDYTAGLASFRHSIEAGFSGFRYMKEFLQHETEGVGVLKGTPEYEKVKQMVEQLSSSEP